MKKLTTMQSVDVLFTPKDLADLFWSMDADEQAKFFSELAKAVPEEKSPNLSQFNFQMQSVSDDRNLTNDGRAIMKIIGVYAEPMKMGQP